MDFTVRRSSVDSAFLEVLKGGSVVREIEVGFDIRGVPPSFDSLGEVEKWLRETERKLAKGAAYRWLAGRSYPKAVLLKKMKAKGYSTGVCEEILLELEKLGYLRDADYLERAIEKELARGYGPRYIEMKLRGQGLDETQVRRIVDEKKQRESIRKILPKFRKAERPKTIQSLLRRGFDFDIILKVLD